MTEQAKAASSPLKQPENNENPARRLLDWYDQSHRELPWRSLPGMTPNPYHVWLSEIMLQQTTVATVMPRFQAFLRRWPGVETLAAASLDDVLHEWQGLGYYARARNLHACAVVVVREHGGKFPTSENDLRKLPGIGDYTAAAVAAIAFGAVTAPVDGNIIRVISRLYRFETPMPAGKKRIAEVVAELVPGNRPGDFAQAMMDLGAMICTPRKPKCGVCPWMANCRASAEGETERFPVKKAKGVKPLRYGTVFWLTDGEGKVLLGKRPEKGLLGGMMEFPSTEWRDSPWDKAEAVSTFPYSGDHNVLSWQELNGDVRHTFTHFHLVLEVLYAQLSETEQAFASNGVWCKPDDFHKHALPTVMKKVAAFVSNGAV